MPAKKAVKHKRFSFEWGSGVVEEEVQVETEWHRPTLQLLRYDDPSMGRSVRFATYGRSGSFSRMPLMVDEASLRALGVALRATPKLRRLLSNLVR